MSNGDYADRVRTARVRDRATWAVAAASTAATTCTVAATLGLAATLPVPSPEPAAVPSSGSVPAPPESRETAAPDADDPATSLRALRPPDTAPTERRRSSKPARERRQSQQTQQDAPRTSGS